MIWDLFHYGFPRTWICGARIFRSGLPIIALRRPVTSRRVPTTPSISRRSTSRPSWLLPAGERGLFAPHCTGRGWDLKVALIRAAINGIDAIRYVRPDARMVNADPLCRVALSPSKPESHNEAHDFNHRLVFQSWDMLSGRLLPELGGSRAHLDIVGINYYWTNQWEWRIEPLESGEVPPLADDDPRRVKLADLVRNVQPLRRRFDDYRNDPCG